MLGCENLNTNICSGKNINIPKECLQATRSDRFNGIIAFFSIIVHVFVLIKIQIFKRTMPAGQHPISHKNKISWRNFLDSNLFLSLIQNTINFNLCVCMAIAPGVIKKFTFDNNHGNLYDILNRLVRIPLLMLLLMANYCYFNRAMFHKVLQAYLNWLSPLKRDFLGGAFKT